MNIQKPEFSSKIRQVMINGELHFSVLDVFALHDDARNAWRSWKRVEKRLSEQGFDVTSKLTLYQFIGAHGKKTRPTPVANFNTFLRIAQIADFKDWEEIRQYMADLAEQHYEEQATIPGSKEFRKLLVEGFSPEESRQW